MIETVRAPSLLSIEKNIIIGDSGAHTVSIEY